MAKKSDAEINLRVNMPASDEFKKALAKTEALQKAMAAKWGKLAADVDKQAQTAAKVVEAARGTKFENTVEHTYKGIAYNDLVEEAGFVEAAVKGAEARISEVLTALSKEEMTEAEALAQLKVAYEELSAEKKYLVELEKQYENVKVANAGTEWIYEAVEAVKSQIAEGEKLHGVMQAQEAEYMRLADAEKEYRAGLDKTSASYERDAVAAQQREVFYKKAAAAQRREAKALQEKVEATRAVLTEGLKEEDFLEAQNKLLEQGNRARERSVAISDEVQLKAAGWRAEEEKADEARVASAKREAELAAQREKREAEAALREAERAEQEQFAMKLSLLNKEQLIKKLQELQAAREAAAEAGDDKTYKKRTREFMAAREQMEKVNTQLNLSRMAWTQQAQMANQFAGSLTNVAERLANVGDAAAKGELDLVGLAGGVQEMGTQFASMLQAGMGPLGALTLILQMAQTAWNKVKAEERERMEQLKAFNEQQKALNDLMKVNTDSLREFARVRFNAEAVKDLVNTHRDLNIELEKEVANIDKAAQAELYRMGLTDDAEEHAMRMKQAELGRQLASGAITQEQYDEQMAAMRLERDKRKLELNTRKAQVEYDAAAEKEKETRATYQQHAEEVSALKREKRGMNWDEAKLKEFEEGRKRSDALIASTTEKYEKLREERGDDDKMTEDARLAMIDAIMAATEYDKEAWQMVDKYFGADHGMTIDEALKKYREKLESVNGRLEAAEEIRAQAEQGLNEAVAERDRLELALENTQTQERLGKSRLDEAHESEAKTRKVNKEQKDKADKREKQFEDMRNKADAMTEEELNLKLKNAREARDNAKNEHDKEFAKKQVELYKGRLKGRRETERERLDRAALENELQSSKQARDAFAQLDLQGALDTMDDGKLSKGEVRMLLRQLKLAEQANNAEAMAMIQEIVRAALASKKMSAEHKRHVKKAFEK